MKLIILLLFVVCSTVSYGGSTISVFKSEKSVKVEKSFDNKIFNIETFQKNQKKSKPKPLLVKFLIFFFWLTSLVFVLLIAFTEVSLLLALLLSFGITVSFVVLLLFLFVALLRSAARNF